MEKHLVSSAGPGGKGSLDQHLTSYEPRSLKQSGWIRESKVFGGILIFAKLWGPLTEKDLLLASGESYSVSRPYSGGNSAIKGVSGGGEHIFSWANERRVQGANNEGVH